MPKKKKNGGVKLSVQRTASGRTHFKKFIAGHSFYLGEDEAVATRLALEIKDWAKLLQIRTRGTPWDAGELADIEAMVAAVKQCAQDPSLQTPASEILNVLQGKGIVHDDRPQPEPRVVIAPEQLRYRDDACTMLHAAVDAFRSYIEGSKSRSESWKAQCAYRCSVVKQTSEDCKLIDFGYDTIGSTMDAWIGNVRSRRWAHATAVNLMTTFRQFLDWADASDKVAWMAPRRWESLVRAMKRQVGALAPKGGPDSDEGRTFSPDELKALYAAANHRQRAFMLLGLNCGFLQSDIADLAPNMVHLKATPALIERHRGKTGVYSRWALWPETIDHLKPAIESASKRSDGLVFRSRRGQAIVWQNDKGNRLDSVWQSWRRLTKTVGLAGGHHSFKYLRKTGAQFVRDVAGKEVSEAYLAHAETGVGTHYHRFNDWPRLDAALQEVRTRLQAMLAE